MRIPGLSLPWWRRLAERPAQRCLIPLTACTLSVAGQPGRDRRATWFALAEVPVFTVAGLWRESGDARCFALVECEDGDLNHQTERTLAAYIAGDYEGVLGA